MALNEVTVDGVVDAVKGGANAVAGATAFGSGVVGNVAGKVSNGFGLGLINFGGQFLANSLPSIASLYGLGYVGQKVLGDVGNGHFENDGELEATQEKTRDFSNDDDNVWMSESAVEAIEEYLRNIMGSLDVIVGEIVNDEGVKAYSELQKRMNIYLSGIPNQVKEYVEKNSAIVQALADERKKDRENQMKQEGATNTMQRLTDINNFLDSNKGKTGLADTFVYMQKAPEILKNEKKWWPVRTAIEKGDIDEFNKLFGVSNKKTSKGTSTSTGTGASSSESLSVHIMT